MRKDQSSFRYWVRVIRLNLTPTGAIRLFRTILFEHYHLWRINKSLQPHNHAKPAIESLSNLKCVLGLLRFQYKESLYATFHPFVGNRKSIHVEQETRNEDDRLLGSSLH